MGHQVVHRLALAVERFEQVKLSHLADRLDDVKNGEVSTYRELLADETILGVREVHPKPTPERQSLEEQ